MKVRSLGRALSDGCELDGVLAVWRMVVAAWA